MNTTNQKVSRRDAESAEKSWEKRTLTESAMTRPDADAGLHAAEG